METIHSYGVYVISSTHSSFQDIFTQDILSGLMTISYVNDFFLHNITYLNRQELRDNSNGMFIQFTNNLMWSPDSRTLYVAARQVYGTNGQIWKYELGDVD